MRVLVDLTAFDSDYSIIDCHHSYESVCTSCGNEYWAKTIFNPRKNVQINSKKCFILFFLELYQKYKKKRA